MELSELQKKVALQCIEWIRSDCPVGFEAIPIGQEDISNTDAFYEEVEDLIDKLQS